MPLTDSKRVEQILREPHCDKGIHWCGIQYRLGPDTKQVESWMCFWKEDRRAFRGDETFKYCPDCGKEIGVGS